MSGPGENAVHFAEIEHFDINYDGTWLATVRLHDVRFFNAINYSVHFLSWK